MADVRLLFFHLKVLDRKEPPTSSSFLFNWSLLPPVYFFFLDKNTYLVCTAGILLGIGMAVGILVLLIRQSRSHPSVPFHNF